MAHLCRCNSRVCAVPAGAAASATCSKPGFVAAAFEGLKPLCKRSPRVVGAEPRRDRRRRDYARCPQRPRPACRATQRFDRSHHSRASWARRQANRRRQRQRSQAGIGRCFQDKVGARGSAKGENESGCSKPDDEIGNYIAHQLSFSISLSVTCGPSWGRPEQPSFGLPNHRTRDRGAAPVFNCCTAHKAASLRDWP